jgi:hypothetical protein
VRRQPSGPDPHEQAVARGSGGLGPYEPLPALLRRGDLRKVLLVVVVGVVALGALRSGGGGKAPTPPGSCDRPALALGHEQVRTGRILSWTVSARAGQVVLTADSTSVDRGRVTGPVQLKDCVANGRFLVQLDEGTHVVRAFVLDADGTGHVVGSRRLTVEPQ